MTRASIENNVRIAVFMGMEKRYSYLHGGTVYVRQFSEYNEDELRYDSSFDWLMPVAQEIIYKYPELSNEFDANYKKSPYDKKHIYSCVMEFIDNIKK